MIYPKKNRLIRFFLHQYVKWAVGNHFHRLLFNNEVTDLNRSVLLLANHFSFWDGLILYCINQKLLKKNFYVMVGEDTIPMMRFLKYGGAFSVNKNSRRMLESLDYAAKLLNDPGNLVLLYPQGKLYANFVTDVKFEKGVLTVIDKADVGFELVFASTFVQYFNYKKPTATVYLKKATKNYRGKSIDELKNDYQEFYDDAKLQQIQIAI